VSCVTSCFRSCFQLAAAIFIGFCLVIFANSGGCAPQTTSVTKSSKPPIPSATTGAQKKVLHPLHIQVTSKLYGTAQIKLFGPAEESVTGSVGDFKLPPGGYTLVVSATGYKPFKKSIRLPDNKNLAVALTPDPTYLRKRKEQEEQRRKAEASEASRQTAAQEHDDETFRLARKMVKQRLKALEEWPSYADHGEVLAQASEKLSQEGSSDDFSVILDHLEFTTTSNRHEAAKLIAVAGSLVKEAAPHERMSLLRVARLLRSATPAEGRPHDLVEAAAGLLYLSLTL
jgi:hypothetical protein